ncbi:MAG: CPBP family intramembrane metalloprotease [candidate division KSB1 bacterium]|nr:CPBP family intramembrane metalloprotease [candidate division KSB1 bacterium]
MATMQSLWAQPEWRKHVYMVLGVWLIMSLAGILQMLSIQDLSTFQKSFSVLLWIGLLLAYLGQMIPGLHESFLVENPNSKQIILFVLIIFYVAFIVYANAASALTPRDLLVGAGYLAVPVALAYMIRNKPLRLSPGDAILILLIWFPIEFGLLPEISIPFKQGLVSMYHLYGIILAILIFLAIRRIPDMGLRIYMSRREVLLALKLSAIFFIVFALPIGLSTGFIRWQIDSGPLWKWFIGILGTAFFIAFPEEILFRGIIQKLIEKRMQNRPGTALIIASIIFGLAHANNPKPPYLHLSFGAIGAFALPWVYVVLATIAGWFYGKAYQKTGSIAAAALVHTVVDCVWWMFFAG